MRVHFYLKCRPRKIYYAKTILPHSPGEGEGSANPSPNRPEAPHFPQGEGRASTLNPSPQLFGGLSTSGGGNRTHATTLARLIRRYTP